MQSKYFPHRTIKSSTIVHPHHEIIDIEKSFQISKNEVVSEVEVSKTRQRGQFRNITLEMVVG